MSTKGGGDKCQKEATMTARGGGVSKTLNHWKDNDAVASTVSV